MQGYSPCDFDCISLPELLRTPRGFFVLLFALLGGGRSRRRIGGLLDYHMGSSPPLHPIYAQNTPAHLVETMEN